MVAVAAITLVIAGVMAARLAPPPPLTLAGCMVLLFAGVRFHLPIRLGAQRVELAWTEAGFVLALAIAPAPWVVLLTPVAVGAVFAQRRFAPIKTLYNVAHNTAGVAVAAGVLALAAASRPFAGAELAALAAAGVAGGLITYLAVAAVVAVTQDVPLLATWRAAAGLQLLTLAGNLAVALTVLVLARHDPRMVAALPIVVLCLHQGYEGRLRGHQEREAGQQHAAAVGRLTSDLDEPSVLRRAAEDACVLADVEVVDVELPAHAGGPATLYRHSRHAAPWNGDPTAAPPPPGRLVAELPVPTDDDARPGRLRAWLIGGAPDLELGPFEKSALGSLARHTGAAVRNARLHAQQTYHATHDRLTGLPARPLLIDQVEAPLRARHTRISDDAVWQPIALLVIDITGYRELVRTLGHDVAESLLAETARRLQAATDDAEYVAHIGVEDFGVYLPAPTSPAHVRGRALRLLAAVAEPVQLDATQVTLSAAAGAAYSPTPVGSGAELLRQASVALDQARANNLPFDFYDPATDDLGGPAAVVLTSELHAALDDDQLDLHFQPILHLPSGAPLAMEALLRWEHPTKGLLYAGDFITALEHSPDHGRFVAWQLRRALYTRAMWGDRDLPVSINLAARCLLDRRFPDQVAAALQRADVSADQLILEIAETATLTQIGLVGDVLTELRLLGVKIAIDNLGAGDSSLFNLLRVPATHVKVDGYHVRQMLVDPDSMAVVCLGLDLGRRANLQVVAVGVASPEHLTALQQLGCDTAQGPHLARPLLTDELATYLANAPELPKEPADVVIPLDSRRRTPLI